MRNFDYRFLAFDEAGEPGPQPFEVFSYPMGDTTVRVQREAAPRSGTQVLWAGSAVVDWSVVYAWADLAEYVAPGSRRVLVLPYLPSARGDKDTPSPARVNARLAAASGITDIVAIDPHSPVWLDALMAANPEIQVHVIPLEEVVSGALPAAQHGNYAGVISPDRGAVARATAVAGRLGLPVHVAEKRRDPATGKLTGYRLDADLDAGAYLVVDDILDGGGTFMLLADAVPETATLDLWVTHGGFTGKEHSQAVRDRYRNIYTTDSLPSAAAVCLHQDDDTVRQTELGPWVGEVIRSNDLIGGIAQ